MTRPLVSTRGEAAVQRTVLLSEATVRALDRFVARVAAQTGVAAQEIEVRTLALALADFFRRDRLFRSAARDPRLR